MILEAIEVFKRRTGYRGPSFGSDDHRDGSSTISPSLLSADWPPPRTYENTAWRRVGDPDSSSTGRSYCSCDGRWGYPGGLGTAPLYWRIDSVYLVFSRGVSVLRPIELAALKRSVNWVLVFA